MRVSEEAYQTMPPNLQALFVRCPNPGSDEVLELFPESKDGVAVGRNASAGQVYGGGKGLVSQEKGTSKLGYGGSGSAARFFYSAKTSKSERNLGCEGIYWEKTTDGHILITEDEYNTLDNKDRAQGNIHTIWW